MFIVTINRRTAFILTARINLRFWNWILHDGICFLELKKHTENVIQGEPRPDGLMV